MKRQIQSSQLSLAKQTNQTGTHKSRALYTAIHADGHPFLTHNLKGVLPPALRVFCGDTVAVSSCDRLMDYNCLFVFVVCFVCQWASERARMQAGG